MIAESCASFSQLLLGKLFSNSTDGRSKSKLAILELLGFRLKKLRSLSDPEKISTDGFETLVACCLVGGKSLSPFLNQPKKRGAADRGLKYRKRNERNFKEIYCCC